MVEVMTIIVIITILSLLIGAILPFIYLISIILVQRFHTTYNILTGNVCLTAIICSIYWIIYTLLAVFRMPDLAQTTFWCIFSTYPAALVTILYIHSVTVITINRFVAIRCPNKGFFKKHAWSFISSALQWILSIILSMPNLIYSTQACIYEYPIPHWISIYTFIILIILPAILNTIFNSMVFILVRSSTRRIHGLATTTTSIVNLNTNTRDSHLLRHMVFISVVFLMGYIPIYTIRILPFDAEMVFWASQLIQFLPVISSDIIVIDLFLYNRDLTQYLKNKILR